MGMNSLRGIQKINAIAIAIDDKNDYKNDWNKDNIINEKNDNDDDNNNNNINVVKRLPNTVTKRKVFFDEGNSLVVDMYELGPLNNWESHEEALFQFFKPQASDRTWWALL